MDLDETALARRIFRPDRPRLAAARAAVAGIHAFWLSPGAVADAVSKARCWNAAAHAGAWVPAPPSGVRWTVTPPELVSRPFGSLGSPFAASLDLWRSGYALAAITHDAVVLAAAEVTVTSNPLADLRECLERDGAVDLAWVVQHAPDGDLRRHWEACEDPIVLLLFASVVLPGPQPEFCEALAEALSFDRTFASIHAIQVAARSNNFNGPSVRHLRSLAARMKSLRDDPRRDGGAAIAALRARLPCPTLAQLLEAYRAR